MEIQRLRNLTTKRLHTKMQDIYEDIEFITGERGVMTHQLPNASRAIEPWLREKLTDPRFWDGKYDLTHTGEFDLQPMNADEKAAMFKRYSELPHPFSNLAS